MPTRYLKPGIRDSERIEALHYPDAEILYYRLIVSVDDFGRADARPLMVKSLCFPVRLRATADRCDAWLKDLEKSGLIQLYESDGKRYLQITRWDNKPRAERSKFPEPPHLHTDVYTCPQMLPVTVTGTGTDNKSIVGKNGHDYLNQAKDILAYLNRNTGKAYRPVPSNTKMIEARLKSGATALQIKEVIYAKCQQWGKDEKMMEYLRPATLFNATKFEQYLGELSNGMPKV